MSAEGDDAAAEAAICLPLPFKSIGAAGRLITIDGLDGTGKTTLVAGLACHVSGLGVPVTCTRFPSDWMRRSAFFEQVQRQGRLDEVDPLAFEVEYMVDRIQHCASVIAPALQAGTWIIADRYALSSIGTLLIRLPELGRVALAAAASGAWFHDLCRRLLRPDLALMLSCRPEVAIARLDGREGELDRGIAPQDYAHLQRQALELARANRMTVVEADAPADSVLRACTVLVDELWRRQGEQR